MWFRSDSSNRRRERAAQRLEVRQRVQPVRRARRRLAFLALAVAVLAVLAVNLLWLGGGWTVQRFVFANELFAIDTLEVRTEGFVTAEQVRAWSGVKLGDNLLALDLGRIRRDLELVPFIRSAAVERVLPRLLRIRIAERDPVAQVQVLAPGPHGRLGPRRYYLDDAGVVLVPLDYGAKPPPAAAALAHLPLISGVSAAELRPGACLDSASVQAALRFLALFEASPMYGRVGIPTVDVASPTALLVKTDQGSEVTFGLSQFPLQLQRWALVHDAGLRRQKGIATLDLSGANNAPVLWIDAAALPPPGPRPAKPPRLRKPHV